ncbi:hypothetical protein C9374_001734 [Naegleria lovaniensis]|uniref:Uncharacterized protein n=1 Tax=Naegleria lovaniensis TaxID=51637 RepID=A0AA88KRL7_NAELO|nr:uncharacterized protein C9374_001734 [Naegleria lovaniensis]KAG2387402.1 hypothetical protein C9374_001734 [Naegleria lovaniensis]
MSESNQGLLERTFSSEDEITAADKMKPIVRNDDESKYTTTTENDDTTTPNSSPSQSSTISSSLSIPSPVVAIAMNECSCDDEFTTPSHRAATAITTTTSTTTRTTTHFSICDDLYSPLSSPLSSPSIRTLLNSLKQRQDKDEEEDSLFVLNIDPFEESQQTPSRVLSRNSSNNESKRDRAESFYGIMNNNMNHMNVNNTRRRAFSFMMDPKTLQSNSEILKENLEVPLMMEESNINETNIKKGWMETKESSSLSSPPQQRQHNYDGDDEKDDDEQFLMNTTSTHRSNSRMNNNNIQRTSIISFQDSPLTSTTSLPSCSNQNSNKLVNSSPQSQTTNPSKTNTTMDSYCTRSSVIDYYHDLINKLSRLDFGIIYSILSFYLFTIDDWFMYTQLLLNHHHDYYSSSNTTTTINDPKSQNHEIKKHCSHIVMNMFYGKKYNHLFQVFPSIHWNVTNPEYLKYFTNDPGSSNNNTSNSSSVNHDTSSLYIQCISTSLKSVINHCSHFISNPHFNQISHLFEFKRLKSFHLQYGFHDDSNLTQLLNKSRKSLENMSITSMAFSSDDHHLHHHGSSKDHFHRRRSTSVMTSHSFHSLNSNTRYHPSMPSLHSYHPSIPPYPNVRTLTLYSKYLNQVDFDKLPSALNSLSIYLKYPVIEQNNSSLKNFIQHVVCCSATTTSSSSSSSVLYTPHSTSNGIQDLHLHFNMSHYIQYFTNDNMLHSLSLTYCQIPSNFHWNIFSKLNDLTLNITHPLELNNLCSKIGHQLKRMYLIIDIEEFSNSESFDHFNASCPNLQELHLSDLNYIISKHLSQSQSIVRFGCDSAVNDLMCIDYLLNIKNLSRLDLKVMVNMYAFIDLVKNRSNHLIQQQQHAQPQQQQPWNGASNASLKMIHLNIECLVPTNSSNHDNMNDIPSSMNTNPTSTLNHVETRSRSQSLFSSNHTTNTIRFGSTTTITTNNNTIRSITHNSSELSMSNNSNTSNSNNTAYSPPTNRLSNSTCSRNQFNSLKIHRLELIYRENETISDLGFLTYFRSIEELSIKYGTIYSPLFSQLLSLTNIKKLTLFKTNINHVFLSNKYKVLTFQNIVFIDCHLNSNFLKVLNEYQVVGGDSTMNSWAQHYSANKNGTSRSKSKTLHSSSPISSFNSVSSSYNSTPTPPPHKSSTLNSQESCMLNYIIDGYSLHVVGVPNIVVIQDDLHKLQSKSSNILDDTSTLSCNQSCCIQ